MNALTLAVILLAVALYLLMPQRTGLSRRVAVVALLAAGAVLGQRWLTVYGVDGPGDVLFAVAAAMAVASAVKVITHTKPLYCALYLVLNVLAIAAMVLLVGGLFLAAALILVYAGAIIVIYVFVIMVAQQPRIPDYDAAAKRVIPATLAAMIVGGLVAALPDPSGPVPSPPGDPSNVSAIGKMVWIDHIVSLEIAAVLLLAAVIGAIALARLRDPDTSSEAPTP